MEFGWSPELERFRAEVRQFIVDVMTPELAEEIKSLSRHVREGPRVRAVVDEVERRGWLKKSTPVELGGDGESPWYRYIAAHELRYAGIPVGRGTASMVGPAISRFGSAEQKLRYIPKLWSGEIVCALGYSEPDAGTDLASLKTQAKRDGDDYVVNGQKIWTSGAEHSTHVWLAVRTDAEAPKHRGISVLMVDLKTPGITIKPIFTSAGARTNEVFYDNVRVPREALIGEENRGWYIIADALDHERVTVGVDDHIDLIQLYDTLLQHLASDPRDPLSDPLVCNVLAGLRTDLLAHRALLLTNATLVARGDTPTKEASMVKVWGTELRHRLGDAAVDLLGRYGLLGVENGELAPFRGRAEATYRYAPVVRFAGGTNEVQRNIIAQRGFGLPR